MNAQEYLESKGIFSLDTKKRMNEVIKWMEGYADHKMERRTKLEEILCPYCGSNQTQIIYAESSCECDDCEKQFNA